MPHSKEMLPTITWGDLETAFDDLAITREEKEAVANLLTMTRLLSHNLSPLDLVREIICIAFVLTPESDRLPPSPIRPSAGRRESG